MTAANVLLLNRQQMVLQLTSAILHMRFLIAHYLLKQLTEKAAGGIPGR